MTTTWTAATLFALGLTASASAQTPATTVSIDPPIAPGLLLPNYNRVLIGEKEALEAAAFTARAEGAVAVFYNPAGLGLVSATAVTAGVSTQEWTKYRVAGGAETTARTNSQTVGGVFGLVVDPEVFGLDKWRFGFLIVRPVSVQPALEVRAQEATPGGSLSGTYLTTSQMNDFAPSVGAAYNYSPTLRFGGSIRVSNLSIYQNQSLFLDVLDKSSLGSIESTVFSDGGVWSLVFSGGVQWDATPRVRVGAQFTLPSLRMWGGASAIYRGATLAAGGGRLLTFADTDAEFHYKQPFFVSGGVAVTFERAGIEFDLKQYAGTGTYPLLRSGESVELTTVTSAGATVASLPFPDLTYASKAVTNVALGGFVKLTDAITAHAGFYTDGSPVGEGDVIAFGRMNLVGVTAGASVNIRGFSGSVGLGYVTGENALQSVLLPVSGPKEIRTRSLQLLYGLSIAF